MQYNFDLSKLNKDCCYNIGFQHKAYHVFDCEKENAWIISGFNTKTGAKLTEAELLVTGLPLQTVIPETSPFNAVIDKCVDSFRNYVEKPEKPKFLGYFLRTKDESVTKEFSDILLESSLWADVRFCVYKQPYMPDKEVRRDYMERFRDINKTIIQCYLNNNKHAKFIQLFPKYKGIYDIMDEIIKAVIKAVIYSKNKNSVVRVRDKPIQDTIRYFSNIISEHYDLHNADKNIIKHYIKNFKHIDAYYNCIKSVAPEVIVGVKRIV